MPERYKQEIEDILAQNTNKPDDGPKAGGRRKAPLLGPRARRVRSPGKVLVASLVLLLVGLLVRGIAPGPMTVLFWMGLALFIAAYAMFFVRWGRGGEQQYWRGSKVQDEHWRGRRVQDVRGKGQGQGWVAHLRRRFRH
ncbi:MAG: hypothetical protein EXR48_05980 [Dehalococcoidia bacterium]|nr:hypothetical protein [Dehalococcoidia bacterium]